MKWLLLTFLSFTYFFAAAQRDPLPAATVLANAIEKAATQQKKVFLKFGASWCGWCKRLDAAIKTEPAKSFFDANYIVADVTVQERAGMKHFENKDGDALLKQYNGFNEGLPYFIIFDDKGNFLDDSQMRDEYKADYTSNGENMGCPASPEEVAHFITVLKKTSSISREEAEAIEKQFLNR